MIPDIAPVVPAVLLRSGGTCFVFIYHVIIILSSVMYSRYASALLVLRQLQPDLVVTNGVSRRKRKFVVWGDRVGGTGDATLSRSASVFKSSSSHLSFFLFFSS